ncbi:ribonuclease P protein component [Candidatus Uhrbacteria bacterium RIFCSPLOWO2_12_FULL_46_10]|uniref:Ribonuclease P protein component n=1 Tax=Candidatus Uhrbacteria bacterium RIFCSPLOWO2_01_FULL_47_25 TaxID=1802402 RepID=A0A1F7US74_9BACT|nr:MAG: Ribonuclease P protein component [Parcubacteria group bacterium GW2011_GWA2_46_9]OGL59266.1 MAG: ribonuclease P protein component [Candidatus Uhrbacteria bacterium RIFCSPHIGHO2_01_FULL_46_23]OGL68489.1 MAG: ribonuclease P protein component [Candidatus Uhrbacteria bacterium RIFCSPHIGHO2_02_FULL_47_29]OGL75584.1 MAG: ribonuclease P protein component [Candidatus Uhrbacteria bacterium RIFCSPHIGHO2_12_FULL_46_13]OGL81099.1 MAG: ribonuclease P protein component [Candidatus Uhrbacteria bacteri
MFPQERRLGRRKDISLVLRRGRQINIPGLTLRFRRTNNTLPRCTVVVGTVVSKKAVIRNRLKRQMRHLLAAEIKSLNYGVDIMLTIRPPLLSKTKKERLVILKEALRRARF